MDTELIDRMIVRKTVSIASPSAQKCTDNFPPPLLFSVPRENGLVARKTGCPLSPNLIIINSATLSHSPRGLSMEVEYHFFSDPSPRNDQRPAGNLFANKDKCGVSNTFLFIVYGSPYDVIEHRHEDNSSLELRWVAHFVLNLWTSWTSCNVVNPGKIFHSNSIGSPSIVSKVLCCDESLNHSNCRSQTVFDVGF